SLLTNGQQVNLDTEQSGESPYGKATVTGYHVIPVKFVEGPLKASIRLPVLHGTDVGIIPDSHCTSTYGDKYNGKDSVCTSQAVCNEDNNIGGPLVLKSKGVIGSGQYTLVG